MSLQINVTTSPVTYLNGNDGDAQAQWVTGSGAGTAPYTYEWRRINDDGTKIIIPDQPMGLCRDLTAGNYEYYFKDSSVPPIEETIPFTIPLKISLDFVATLTKVTAFGKADGKIIGYIHGGVAPYRAELKVNGNAYRTVDNIPAPTSDNPNNMDIEGLAPGEYDLWVYDSDTPQNKVGGDTNWNVTSPPYATLNGSVNPKGFSTDVSFQLGTDANYGTEVDFGEENGTGVRDVTLELNSSTLQPGVTYHYRIKAVNVQGISYGDDMTFATPSDPPDVVTLPATNIS